MTDANVSASVRGRLFGERCAGCRMEFTDEDVPTFTGPFAAVAATGWTMTCRYCRQHSDNVGTSLATGWPKCCDLTMRWWTQRQINAGEVPA